MELLEQIVTQSNLYTIPAVQVVWVLCRCAYRWNTRFILGHDAYIEHLKRRDLIDLEKAKRSAFRSRIAHASGNTDL